MVPILVQVALYAYCTVSSVYLAASGYHSCSAQSSLTSNVWVLCDSWVSLNNTSAGPWDTMTDCWHYSDRLSRWCHPHKSLPLPKTRWLINIHSVSYIFLHCLNIKYLTLFYSHSIWIHNRVVQNVFWPVIVAIAESSNRDGKGLPHRVQCVLDHLRLMADGEPAGKITDMMPLKGEHVYIAHIVPVKIIPHHLSAASSAMIQKA